MLVPNQFNLGVAKQGDKHAEEEWFMFDTCVCVSPAEPEGSF